MGKLLTLVCLIFITNAWCQSTIPERIKRQVDSLKLDEILLLKKEQRVLIYDGDLKVSSAGNAGNFSKLTSIQLWGDSVHLLAGTTLYRYKVLKSGLVYVAKPASTSSLEIKQEVGKIVFRYSYSGKTVIYIYEYLPWEDL